MISGETMLLKLNFNFSFTRIVSLSPRTASSTFRTYLSIAFTSTALDVFLESQNPAPNIQHFHRTRSGVIRRSIVYTKFKEPNTLSDGKKKTSIWFVVESKFSTCQK